jgi:hypothetical protein
MVGVAEELALADTAGVIDGWLSSPPQDAIAAATNNSSIAGGINRDRKMAVTHASVL